MTGLYNSIPYSIALAKRTTPRASEQHLCELEGSRLSARRRQPETEARGLKQLHCSGALVFESVE